MKSFIPFLLSFLCAVGLAAGSRQGGPAESQPVSGQPVVVDPKRDVRYLGLARNGIDVFLGVHYGQDTSGEQRFKPPRLFVPARGATVDATAYGAACPQILGLAFPPIAITNVTEISEDCLTLNIARPRGTRPGADLPVLVFLHGGGFWIGNTFEITNAPDGLILQSVEHGLPIVHVHVGYRLGVFGFAKSEALRAEGSENAGLRDHRLALEWVRDNIALFGGNPNRVTLAGQSSGSLGAAMQVLAYGGGRGPAPLQQVLLQSQSLEPGITGAFTTDAMRAVADAVGCNATGLQSAATVRCLRGLSAEALMAGAAATYQSDIAHNIGDIWLPSVDGDFLPDRPSVLLREGRYAKGVATAAGWSENDLSLFTDQTIKTADETRAFFAAYMPGVSAANVEKLLALYPVGEFRAQEGLSAEFYRAAQIFRDILMVCEAVWYGEQVSRTGSDVYLYDWNQTMLAAPLKVEINPAGPLGPVHTSENAYVFGNLSHYDARGYPFNPTPEDIALERRGARSWAAFVATGVPGEKAARGRDVFQGVKAAFEGDKTWIYVAGGPSEGASTTEGKQAHPAVAAQRITERCAFINSPEMIDQLHF